MEVTFRLGLDEEVEGVSLVCDARGWEPVPMKPAKRRNWQLRLRLPSNRFVEFRYLASGGVWLNDEAAHGYVPNGMGDYNSVVSTASTTQS